MTKHNTILTNDHVIVLVINLYVIDFSLLGTLCSTIPLSLGGKDNVVDEMLLVLFKINR